MTLSTEALNCETILPTSVSVTERMRSSFFLRLSKADNSFLALVPSQITPTR